MEPCRGKGDEGTCGLRRIRSIQQSERKNKGEGKKNAVRVNVRGAAENLRVGTNRLREIIKKNDGKGLDKMRNKSEGASERQRQRDREERECP